MFFNMNRAYLLIGYVFYPQGSDSGSFGAGCVNTISASSEWNEWINCHSKWVSYHPGHSIWVPFALLFDSIWAIFSPFNMGNLQHKYSLITMCWELCFALSEHISRPPLPHRSCHELIFEVLFSTQTMRRYVSV